MRLYKFYGEKYAESRENTVSAFEGIIEEQNGNTGSFFDNFDATKKAYDSFAISASASKERTAVTFYSFAGKLIEEGEIDDAEYKQMLDDGESLRDIYGACTNWNTIVIETSLPVDEREFLIREVFSDGARNIYPDHYDTIDDAKSTIAEYIEEDKVPDDDGNFHDVTYQVIDAVTHEVIE